MRIPGGTEQDWIPPGDFIENERFTDDAGKLVRVPRNEAIVIDAIRNTQSVKAGAQVQKHTRLAADPRGSANESAKQPSRVTIKGQPAIVIGLLVKEVQGSVVHIRRLAANSPTALTPTADLSSGAHGFS
jgi:hypothetical protein